MQSKLLQKRCATAPVEKEPSGQMSYEEAVANLSGGMSYEGVVADLFRTVEEDDAAIQQAILGDEEGKPYEQVKAEQDRELETWVAEARRKLRNK